MKPDFRWDNLPTPTWMGVVNVTPNSFSDGGKFRDTDAAVAQVQKLARDGATIIDLGAEASSFFRPGVERVDDAEQILRLHPVITRLIHLGQLPSSHFLSVDTRSSGTANKSLSIGAAIINDISAGTYDPPLLKLVAHKHASIVLMHMSPTFPETPPHDDPNLLDTLRDFLSDRIAAAERAGILREKIAIDPGLGFGKTMPDNWRLLARAHELVDLGCPILLGLSRKRFLTTTPPPDLAEEFAATLQKLQPLQPLATHERDLPTAAATLLALRRGIHLHRVHNVALCHAAWNAM